MTRAGMTFGGREPAVNARDGTHVPRVSAVTARHAPSRLLDQRFAASVRRCHAAVALCPARLECPPSPPRQSAVGTKPGPKARKEHVAGNHSSDPAGLW